MVDGTVTINVVRGVGLRDAAWVVVQPVSVRVDVGKLSACTGDGEGVDPTFPVDTSTFVWQCNDEELLVFTLRATLPMRGVKALGMTRDTSIAKAVQLSKRGPAAFEVCADKPRGTLYVRVEFSPTLAAAPKQAHEHADNAPQ